MSPLPTVRPVDGSVLIRGALICDGTGAIPQRGDVEVVAGRVRSVGEDSSGFIGRTIDADGLVLAPGFIDMHSHGDFTLPSFPQGVHAIAQGVTTEVTGNCGSSPAPLSGHEDHLRQWRARAGIAGERLDWAWTDFDSYLGRLDLARPMVNVVPLVGHGALRAAVMGMRSEPASEEQLATMKTLLRAALAAGAWGMSTGLAFPPGSAATASEVTELAREVALWDGLYATHLRDEGSGLPDALAEALMVGREAGCRVQISHLKAAGRKNHGTVEAALEAIASARAEGVEAWCDAYPYVAASTYLRDLLPAWLLDEGPAGAVARLDNPAVRAVAKDAILAGNEFLEADTWNNVQIAAVANRSLEAACGRRVGDLAVEAGVDPADYVIDLLRADRAATTMVVFSASETDNEAVLRSPVTAIGSDQYGVTDATIRVHPRAYGSHAKVLGWAVRDARLFPIEEAVRRMTGLPAHILGLADRGLVRRGQIADLVLFDPDKIQDRATYDNPTELAVGVEHLLMGGRPVIEDGELVGGRLGRVIRRSGYISNEGVEP